MARRLPTIVVALLTLAACRPKAAPAEAGAPPPDAAPPRDAAPPPPVAPAFTLYARFPGNRNDGNLYRLKDGVAVVEVDTNIWKVSTLRAGEAPVVRIPKRKWEGSTYEESFNDTVYGTTNDLFVGIASGGLLRANAKGVTKIAKHYRHVVELRDGQWIGLRSTASDISFLDDEAPRYELLAGTGDAPVVPSHVRPSTAVRLGDGRICASAALVGETQKSLGGIWTADTSGKQNIAEIERRHHVIRGADGECYALVYADEARTTIEISRVRGDALDPPVVVPLASARYDVVADAEGGVWIVDRADVLHRVLVENGKAVVTKYVLPTGIEHCERPRIGTVAALGANDVWVIAACMEKAGQVEHVASSVLLHTAPAPERTIEWPAF